MAPPLTIQLGDVHCYLVNYDGNPTDLNRYIKSTSTVIGMFNTPEDTDLIFNLVKLKLSGPAFDLLDEYSPNDWPALKTLLISKFSSTQSRTSSLVEINKLSQKPKESIQDYVSRSSALLRNAQDATDKMSESASIRNYLKKENEETIIKTFIDGLGNSTVQSILIAQKFTELAKVTEATLEHSNRLSSINNNKLNSYHKFPKPSNIPKCETCGKLGHSKAQCYRNLPNYSRPQIKREIRQICGYCKKPNHTYNECRSRINSRNNTSQHSERRQINQAISIPKNGVEREIPQEGISRQQENFLQD